MEDTSALKGSSADAERPAPAQRAACDRCRGQKLRCPRTHPGSHAVCDRCQRIGAICRTAPRLPSGRPSLRRVGSTKNKSLSKSAATSYRIPQSPPAELTTDHTLPSPSTTATQSPDLCPIAIPSDLLAKDQASPLSLDHDVSFSDSELLSNAFDSPIYCSGDFQASSPSLTFDSKYDLPTPIYTISPTLDVVACTWPSETVSPRSLNTRKADSPMDHVSVDPLRTLIEGISCISARMTEIQDSAWLDNRNVLDEQCQIDVCEYSQSVALHNDEQFAQALMAVIELYRLSHRSFKQIDPNQREDFQWLTVSLSSILLILSAHVQTEQLIRSLLTRTMASYYHSNRLHADMQSPAHVIPWWQGILGKIQILESHCQAMESLLQGLCDIVAEPVVNKARVLCFDMVPLTPLARTMALQVLASFSALKAAILQNKLVILGL